MKLVKSLLGLTANLKMASLCSCAETHHKGHAMPTLTFIVTQLILLRELTWPSEQNRAELSLKTPITIAAAENFCYLNFLSKY